MAGEAERGRIQQAGAQQHDAQQHFAEGFLVQDLCDGIAHIQADQSADDCHAVQRQVAGVTGSHEEICEEFHAHDARCCRCGSHYLLQRDMAIDLESAAL